MITQNILQQCLVTVKRNAYGRQLGSFHTNDYVKGIGQVPMTFIRAPYISQVDGNVDVLANGRWKNCWSKV